ncbi:TPA: hypothetical protein ACX6MG_000361 [Photobacterium damselae]
MIQHAWHFHYYKKKHKLDKDIVRLCEIIVTGLDNGSSKEVVLRNLYLLEEKLQQLIKQEWDKSKEEVVTGKIECRKKSHNTYEPSASQSAITSCWWLLEQPMLLNNKSTLVS